MDGARVGWWCGGHRICGDPYIGYFPLPSVTFNSTAATRSTNGTTFRFKVSATNAVGTGPTSTVTNPVTPMA